MLGVLQAMRPSSKVAQLQHRRQRLELQWGEAGAQLRRQGQLQHRRPGREVAALQMCRRLLGRLQERWLPSKEARQLRQRMQQGQQQAPRGPRVTTLQ